MAFLYDEIQFPGLRFIPTEEEGRDSLSPREILRLRSELMLKWEAHHPMGTQHVSGSHRLCSQKGPCIITIQMGKLRLEIVCSRDCHKACARSINNPLGGQGSPSATLYSSESHRALSRVKLDSPCPQWSPLHGGGGRHFLVCGRRGL